MSYNSYNFIENKKGIKILLRRGWNMLWNKPNSVQIRELN
jgi:hypothetical protein